ncbi:hypothetical protein [Actinophytocola xanthii]|uniref:Ornithine cyclodeaminase n=1 Tax=Actinophytocola xanthii TaxID=1912961 RepID=A0A1Q8CAA7_9PSEU|nr:hypothetical protein [Actinophytocola xanthii]OLF11279.1 hypothetical protein BU204_30610 [Actinophytocola xanthii]
MTETILRLHTDEVWRALDAIDAVSVLAEDLIGRTVARVDHHSRPLGALLPWTGPRPADAQVVDLVVLEHPPGTETCLVPAESLRLAGSAALAALAARALLVPGGITVAVVGTPGPSQPQLSVIARHVPDISHVALCLTGIARTTQLEPELLDQLQLSGIGLSVVDTASDAVFGANLVLVAGDTPRADLAELRLGRLARGAVLINATGRDLPATLVDRADQVVVDDLALLSTNGHRYVVAAHRAALAAHHAPRIAADLGQLLTGRDAADRQADAVVLVELLGVWELNPRLAVRIYQAAQRSGLGSPIHTNGK